MFDLKRFREERNLSQKALADLLGIGQSFVSQIEGGKDPMPEALIAKLIDLYPQDDLSSVNQYVNIGIKLKVFFDEHGFTQQDVADKLGVSQAAVSALLNGKPFGKKLAQKWGDTFGIKPNWLLTGEGEMLKSMSVNQNNVNRGNVVGDNIQGYSVTVNKTQTDKFLELLKTRDEQISKNQEQISKSQDQIDRLIGIIEKLNNI